MVLHLAIHCSSWVVGIETLSFRVDVKNPPLKHTPFYYTVSGEANFSMPHTGLTIGGFTQPSVARNLLEQPVNIEKGLCQRLLWLVPKPTSVPFEDLQCVDKEFTTAIGKTAFIHIFALI